MIVIFPDHAHLLCLQGLTDEMDSDLDQALILFIGVMTLINVYTTKPENIVECFTSGISLSDHYPFCVTRKVNSKVLKASSYRSFNFFLTNDNTFISDLSNNLNDFVTDKTNEPRHEISNNVVCATSKVA